MPFSSSEIRWFSQEEKLFRQLFDAVPGDDNSAEPVRTDYYLRTDSFNTGVKIRQGNHEIKVKIAADEMLDFGVVEHWMKWSVPEKDNILTKVNHKFLVDWIEVKKSRFKKNFDLSSGLPVKSSSDIFLKEGCGIELTVLTLPQFQQTAFTFGLEAFSSEDRCRENLHLTLTHFNAYFSRLANELSCGYPQWLSSVI